MSGKKGRSLSGIGTLTVLTVLLVLCLTVFAVLTYVSAQADLRVSRKNADTVEAYYAADNRGTALIKALAGLWPEGADMPDAADCESALSQAEPDCAVSVSREGRGLLLSCSVPVDDRRSLVIAVFYSRDGGEQVEIRSWKLSGGESGVVIDDELPVWQG